METQTMQHHAILDEFPIPPEAVRDLQRKHLYEERPGNGVSVMTSGHHGGLSYRFFVNQERNAVKSEAIDFPIFDEEDMIEWYRDSKNKIVEKVRFLPKELLRFDKFDGTCIGGIYKETYDRFKAGLEAPGMPLRKWNVVPEGGVKALEEFGIFTVEQFAAQPRNRIQGRFPKEMQEAFQQAIEFVNGKDSREQAQKNAEQLASVLSENAKLTAEMAALRAQMESLLSGRIQISEPKKSARPKAARKAA